MNKALGIFLITLLSLLCIYNYIALYQKTFELGELKAQLTSKEKIFKDQLKEAHTDATILISSKDKEIKRLKTALDTAFKKYPLVQTLLAKDVGEWTVDSVLQTKATMAKIPSGSWFKDGHYVTAPYGSKLLVGTHWGTKGHRGVDLKPKSGDNYEPVISTIDGKVVTWGRNDRLYGNYIVIESLDGMFQIKLAHLSSIAIFKEDGSFDLYEGMLFKKGDRIARMGNTGNTTGPHLHAEYYIFENNNWRLLNASTILNHIGE